MVAIETHFRNIAVPCIILLVVLVISIIFNAIFPKNDKKLKVDTSAKTLYQLSSKFDIDNADKGIQNALKGISNVKIILNVIPIVIYVAMIVVTLVFACNRDNYTLDDMNGSVIDIVLIVLPCVIVGIAVYFVSSLLKSIFRKKEINLIKNAIKENKDLLLKEKKMIDEKNAIKSLILKVKNLWYTNENIDQMLMERHLAKKARNAKKRHHLKGPAKRMGEDDKRFAEALDKLIILHMISQSEL